MKNICLLILLITLSSCNLFYKTVFGIKNPKIETYYSINRYVESIDVDSSLVLFTKDSASYFELNKMFLGLPEVVIFNKAYKFIPYKNDSINCNASVDIVLHGICNLDTVNLLNHRTITYKEFINKIEDHNKFLDSLSSMDFDFIVFVDFAKYLHKINKNHIPDWNRALKNHDGDCKTKIVYVDLDYLNTWHISKNSLPKFKLSANKK